ncbi:hypothetical protein [Bradyrhizobium lablabi]|uniref:hypothetical protein n=1 Tax=Bradyrhizobium lablabi TaxID=722472 RepID=UPI001BA796CE|nr:hypothetical protein [Bradyrhizobium lablabi]MBR0692261.1 hypothetical protein [Bradyrhizobium lablabi]
MPRPKGDLVNELLGRSCVIAVRDAPTYRLKASCELRRHFLTLGIILEQAEERGFVARY